MADMKEKYEAVESKVDSVLTHLVALKWTAVVIAGMLILDFWLVV